MIGNAVSFWRWWLCKLWIGLGWSVFESCQWSCLVLVTIMSASQCLELAAPRLPNYKLTHWTIFVCTYLKNAVFLRSCVFYVLIAITFTDFCQIKLNEINSLFCFVYWFTSYTYLTYISYVINYRLFSPVCKYISCCLLTKVSGILAKSAICNVHFT